VRPVGIEDVHCGEVERDAGNLRGVAVHAVTRISAPMTRMSRLVMPIP
jgi:hypothetical protein